MKKSGEAVFSKSIRPYVLLSFLFALIWVVYACKQTKTESDYIPIESIAVHANGEGFAGSESCAACHSDIYKTHVETAHYNTSTVADSMSIKGSFADGQNGFTLGDSYKFTMIANDSAFIEQAHNLKKNQLISESRIDMVFGSGTKGQSYLTWNEDKLFQLQASYFAPTESWVNSPGYSNRISSKRPIQSRCMECHTTYAENTQAFSVKNLYKREQLIYGIDCERCHGPSAKHVGFHISNPEVVKPKFMLQSNKLSRQQRLDACALCHSGIRGQSKQLPFSFITGDKLSEFSTTDYKEGDEIDLDVHGNQYGLLTSSECFKQTETMDCATCHNPHKNERGNTAAFNQKCIGCHAKTSIACAEEKSMLAANDNNCIQCHMPLSPSKAMRVQVGSDTIPVMVRTHLIDVYVGSL